MQATRPRETVLDFTSIAYASIEKNVIAAIHDGASEIVLRLDHLETLEVADLRNLIVLLRRAREAGGALTLQTTKPQIRRILAVTALDRLFTVRAASEAA